MPSGWKAVFHEGHQEWFYANTLTGETTWQKPINAAYDEGLTAQKITLQAASSSSTNGQHYAQAGAASNVGTYEYYGSNGSKTHNSHSPEKSDAAIEQEILGEYSFSDGHTATSPKASAWSLKRNCRVMIKRYNKSSEFEIARANREILSLRGVSDPSIPPLIDYFDPAESIFVVMEDREDENLKRYIEGRGSLSEAQMKAIMLQLFSATAQVFNAGFAHLRICDETLFIDHKNMQLTLKDFDCAHEYGKDKVDDLYASIDVRYGSDIYTAPEVFAPGPYNARKAVIWSCGVAAVSDLPLPLWRDC